MWCVLSLNPRRSIKHCTPPFGNWCRGHHLGFHILEGHTLACCSLLSSQKLHWSSRSLDLSATVSLQRHSCPINHLFDSLFFCFWTFYFVWRYSRLTMLLSFQVNGKGTQPYIHVCPCGRVLPPPIQGATQHLAELHVLCNRSLLVIHFILCYFNFIYLFGCPGS